MSGPPVYRVHAIKYAELKQRPAHQIIIGADPHDGPFDMDYFVWLIEGPRTIVVDTGFSSEVAARRGRKLLRTPAEGLRDLGVDAKSVRDVIVTHLHFDHIGNFAEFPEARFHVQDREVSFATGRHMTHPFFRAPYEVSDILAFVKGIYDQRVVFHDGVSEVCPGVTLHPFPGHTAGLQVVRVHTENGWLVLASDASHYDRHRRNGEVFPIVFDVPGVLEGYRALIELASNEEMIVPGHDPSVMKRFPPSRTELTGIAVRLG